MKTKVLFLIILFPIILLGCKQSDSSILSTEPLDDYFKNEMPANEPGGAIIIMKNDSVIFSQGYGMLI